MYRNKLLRYILIIIVLHVLSLVGIIFFLYFSKCVSDRHIVWLMLLLAINRLSFPESYLRRNLYYLSVACIGVYRVSRVVLNAIIHRASWEGKRESERDVTDITETHNGLLYIIIFIRETLYYVVCSSVGVKSGLVNYCILVINT